MTTVRVEAALRRQFAVAPRGEVDVPGGRDGEARQSELVVGLLERGLPLGLAGRTDAVVSEQQVHEPGAHAQRAQPVDVGEAVGVLVERPAQTAGVFVVTPSCA